MGDTPMQTNANFQVETMIADVENMCNAGCDGVCLWIPDDSLYDAFIGICSKYNVPFVLVDKVPQDPEIAERVKSNPLFVGAVCPANAVYGQKIADYAVAKGWDTVLIGTPSKGDASDTPRLDAFLETFQAAGGTVIDILYSENGNDAQTRLEASMMAEEPVFIYGTGSDYGIAAANALENTGMVGIPVVTSGLDAVALEYEAEGKIEMINGDFWVAGYFESVLMEAYLHGNKLVDADGNVPYITDIQPFEVPAEQYELFKSVFLSESGQFYTAEETAALVNGTYDDFVAAIQNYNLEERAAALGVQ